MTEELLKYTKSLSPLSLQAIDAKVISDGQNIYMVKKDEHGKEYKALIEKDKNLYLLLTRSNGEPSAKMQTIHTYASAKCNLNCQVCYEKYSNHTEIEREEVNELLEKYPDCKVVMMGMEPTCREDIFELVEMAGNRASLNTNGIKLESLEYVKKLKAHGLKNIFFSFNGLNDEIYLKMNGGNYLEAKLKALENIGREKIDTLLSATLAKNINEDQILPLVKFCFEHRSFIVELRTRTLAPIGKHLNAEQICMSELIKLFADELHINKADILREFCFMQIFLENFRWLLPKGFRDKFGSKLCSFVFNIKKESEDKYSSPGSRIDLDRINNSSFKSLYLFYYLIKAYGPFLLAEIALYLLHLPRFVVQKKMLNIVLKCWPNLYNVDLTEMSKCPSAYYKNGEMERFCLSNIKYSAIKEGLK
ncbi:MAG: hypothetical protein CVU62_02545 [Deltaproteobacteria bacterium HGW-Deltaproteobacteria-2]|jgi:uncharacterized Fe-S cluster-containing radical SAM superfamily protein|nr:MAG: hypothetical protein CVU62_02545 [Deltaproteobacteria bacterium HGW-Deltaproteobacteria-2]